MDLENAEEILQILERYTKQKSKTIPDELNSYLNHVALTGDSVYSWNKVQYFFREKLTHVIKDFHDTTPTTEDLPISRNVDAFNYESLKTTLLERFDLFNAAPFTIQRLSELLSEPKKHYCRLDKFMRALEKNILVVSTVEPGHRQMGSENGDSLNGDPLMDVNVDVEMDKEPSSSNVSPTTDNTVIETQQEIPTELDSKTEVTNTVSNTETGNGHVNEEDKLRTTNNDEREEHDKRDEDDGQIKEPEEVSKSDEKNSESNELDKTDNENGENEKSTVDFQSNKVDSPDIQNNDVNESVTNEPSPSDLEEKVTKSLEDDSGKADKSVNEESNSTSELSIVAAEDNVEKPICNDEENVKKSRPHEDDDEDFQESEPKLLKLDQLDEDANEPLTKEHAEDGVDEVPSTECASDVQATSQTNDEIEKTPEPVLETSEETTVSHAVEEPVTNEISNIPEIAPHDTIDEIKCETETVNTVTSPHPSTETTNIDEVEEDVPIEPIITDTNTEQNSMESAPVTETDVEMTPLKSVDNPEEMAFDDNSTNALPSSNSDLSMDATQSIPSDEQMDVFESNLIDQMDL